MKRQLFFERKNRRTFTHGRTRAHREVDHVTNSEMLLVLSFKKEITFFLIH
jgi:hypothetical protein